MVKGWWWSRQFVMQWFESKVKNLSLKNSLGSWSFIYDILRMISNASNKVIRHYNFLTWSLNVSWSRAIYVIFDINLLSISLSLHDFVNNNVDSLCFLTKFISTKLFAKASISVRYLTLTSLLYVYTYSWKFNCLSYVNFSIRSQKNRMTITRLS